MIVEQSQLEQINSKIRRRTLELPVRYGKKFGELKKCPLQAKGVYKVRARVPYGRYLLEAYAKPTHKLGVLWLIEQCEIPVKTIIITVTEVERQDERWLIHFNKGDQSDYLDRPRLLSARPGRTHGDYTNIPSLSMPTAAEEVPADVQRIYKAQSVERLQVVRNGSYSAHCAAIRQEIAGLGADPRISGNVRGLERQLTSLERKLSG